MYRNRRLNARTLNARLARRQADLARARAALPAAEARVRAATAAHDALVAEAGDDWFLALIGEEASEVYAAEAALQQLQDEILDAEIDIDLLQGDLEHLRNLQRTYPGAY